MTVAGWGKQQWGGEQERFLRKVELPFKPDAEYFDDPWWEENPAYPRATICGRAVDQKSHCGGDSGGPALHRLPDGIVSAGGDCEWDNGEEATPVYTDVAYFSTDIQQAVDMLLADAT
ncbi:MULTISPECIES: trypsin-like serine protease [Actinoplanes]|uniref:trypsin-like serine protease n=1 Tax=Actinoplanes TaxID=1865 RepID=UPI0005F2A173|nr:MULTISPECIES: trypsin-like serine protease [Actinoplanes]GLY00669.1 hypothetical protein Acsp01_10480 [Actinoplanes sp. NBRC 101535]